MASEKESLWIDKYIETGDGNLATREIFNSAEKNVSIRTCSLKARLGTEIDKRLRKAMRHNSVTCYSMLAKLAKESDSDQVKVKALTDLLDRGGYKPIDQHEEVIEVKTKDQVEAEYLAAKQAIHEGMENDTLQAQIEQRNKHVAKPDIGKMQAED